VADEAKEAIGTFRELLELEDLLVPPSLPGYHGNTAFYTELLLWECKMTDIPPPPPESPIIIILSIAAAGAVLTAIGFVVYHVWGT
jgi:hypothetical protein